MNDEFALARLNRAKSSEDISPAQLLRAVAMEIERGTLVCDGILLLWANRPEDGEWDFGSYRSHMAYDQELVTLELAKARLMEAWRD